MFGYVTADLNALTPEQQARYRGAYCGLCRALKQRHGQLSRLTLNYDMTFLVLLLSSMYEPAECSGTGRCIAHPVHCRDWWQTRFTDYAADMTVALAYYNCMDDWTDEKKPLSLLEATLLRSHYQEAAARWPGQCAAIRDCIDCLSRLEQANAAEPDAAADSFGQLMGALFAPEPGAFWKERFFAFGRALGRFIYIMDACMDMEADRKKGRYNPLLRLHPEGMAEEEMTALLKVLIADAAAEFEKLPLTQDMEILRSVLYSGVWTKYAAMRKKTEKRDAEHGA